MRRLLSATGLAVLAAAALAGTAAAKEMSVSLSGGPPPLDPGQPWNARLLVHGEPAMLAEATPAITIRNDDSGETRTFAARATGNRAADGQLIYRVRVVAPSDGWWRYSLTDGVTDREYAGGLLAVGEPATEPTAPAPTRADPVGAATDDDSSLPSWPFVAGGIALVLAAVGVAIALRHRPQPSA
jgi:hypothetical protein